jgi:hypothetical protein
MWAVGPDGVRREEIPMDITYGATSGAQATIDTSLLAEPTPYFEICSPPYYTPSGSGLTREVWTNVGGTSVSDIPITTTPAITETLNPLNGFECPQNWADNYGTRVRGYLTPPTTGNYTFWIASDDAGELWISTDTSDSRLVYRRRIAYVSGWTHFRGWNQYSTQKSAEVYLTQGKQYYIEALQKERGGWDHLSVGWSKPGQSNTAPSEVIPGSVLSPYFY